MLVRDRSSHRAACAGWLLALGLLAPIIVPAAHAQTLLPESYTVDGTVAASAATATRLYLGGTFQNVGRVVGTLASIDRANLALSHPEWNVKGTVSAIEPDGTGGFFVGGVFTSVLGQPRSNLAHILAPGSLSPWNPGVDGSVVAILRSGNSLYVGGLFSVAAGVPRSNLVELDPESGAARPWAPAFSSAVRAFALAGDTLFVGGDFTLLNGVQCANVVGVSRETGANLTPLMPGPYESSVTTVSRFGSRLVVGGTFDWVGQASHGLARLDPVTAAVKVPALPVFNGSVRTVLEDGAGGWFVGGSFTTAGGVAHKNLVHVRADATIDPWDPAPDQIVLALARSGGVLYVGGSFITCAGQTRHRLAAFDESSLALLAWNPDADATVNALAIDGTTMFAGGAFLNVGGVPHARLVALDLTSGAVLPSHTAGADGVINALAVASDRLYVGGAFNYIGPQNGSASRVQVSNGAVLASSPQVVGATLAAVSDGAGGWFLGGHLTQVNGQPRTRLAHVLADGTLDPWAPVVDNAVLDLERSGDTLIVAGAFNTVAGQTRNGLAAFSIASGALLAWNPNVAITPGEGVNAIELVGQTLYLGGRFTQVGNQSRSSAAAVDLATGAPTAWNPGILSFGSLPRIYALASAAGRLYVGGEYSTVGVSPRQGAASFDLATGTVTSWSPGLNSTLVTRIAANASTVYLAGGFSSVSGQARNGLAAVDAVTGVLSPWNPAPDNSTYAMLLDGSTLYLAGNFTSIGGQSRARLAALDATTGVPTAWAPNADQAAEVLVRSGSEMLIAGNLLRSVGGLQRRNLAAVTLGNGAPFFYNPDPNGTVNCMAVSGTQLYFGGAFTNVAGLGRSHVAAYDTGTGLLGFHGGNINGAVLGIALTPDRVIVSGEFNYDAVTFFAANLVMLDRAASTEIDWRPPTNGAVQVVRVSGGDVVVGGDFTRMGGLLRSRIAMLDPQTSQIVAAWGPSFTTPPRCLMEDRDRILIGGDFGVRVFDAIGATVPFASPLTFSVRCFARSGDTLYVGGSTAIGIRSANIIDGTPLGWTSVTNGSVDAIAVVNGQLIAGGTATSYSMIHRANLVAVNSLTGGLDPWDPSPNGAVSALQIADDKLWIAGNFTTIQSASVAVPRLRLAVCDTLGTLQNFAVFSVDAPAEKFKVFGNTVYMLGPFTSIGGNPRPFTAAFVKVSGGLKIWNPRPNNLVHDLDVADGLVYLGGEFSTISTTARSRVAAVDTVVGTTPTALAVTPIGFVMAVAVDGNSLLLGGNFTRMNGIVRSRLAAVDRTTGTLLPWDPIGSGSVNHLLVAGDVVYVAGNTLSLGGQPMNFLGAVDRVSGARLPWSPLLDNQVTGIQLDRGAVHVVGGFLNSGTEPRRNFAMFSAVGAATVVGVEPGPRGASFALSQNAPNPFRGSTTIRFALPTAGRVTAQLLDVNGRLVRTLADGQSFAAGEHSLALKGDGLKPGLYWYRVTYNGTALTKRMVAIP